MSTIVVAAAVWLLVLWAFLRGSFGPSLGQWSREIAFAPTEPMSREQLFGCLLGGNFALLLRDNFNQFGSGLSERRIRGILRHHWAIHTRFDCARVIQSRLESLGRMSPSEKRAVAAWLAREPIDTNEYAALEDACTFMARRACIARVDDLRRDHLGVLAWDIQQLACLVRLARTVDYVSKARAEELLALLAVRARAHFAAWSDYSLAALVGLGLRGSLEVFDSAEWTRFARTHAVFLHERWSPTFAAARWSESAGPPPAARRTVAFTPSWSKHATAAGAS